MWTISKEQLKAVSNSMRNEFERRACFAMTKEMRDLPLHEIQHIVHSQVDKIVAYNIEKEASMMQFIRLSFEYPVLRSDMLPELLHTTLSSKENEDKKIDKFISLLNTYYYGI